MGYAKESALTPKADVRGPMSAFPPISSALHLGADVLVTCPRLPVLTLSGHRAGGYPFSLFGCGLMNIRDGGPPSPSNARSPCGVILHGILTAHPFA